MGKKSAAEAEKTRKLIVATARELFAELGFAGATTSRIAKSAGLTEGAFFHHFKDKKALFAEVVKNLQREFAHAVVLRGQKGDDPLERFIIGARASIELSQSPEYLRLVLIEAPTILGGENWREIDAVTSLSVIEPALVAITGRDQIDPTMLRPMALLVLGLLNLRNEKDRNKYHLQKNACRCIYTGGYLSKVERPFQGYHFTGEYRFSCR